MKLVPPDQRQAVSAVRLALSLVATALLPLLLYATPPWWFQHNVLVQNAVPDDYAPANQGQLKNIATAAVAEMESKLAGGAGEELHNLINSWSTPAAPTNDFAPVNLGQLKKVARPFYDRLIALGIVDYYPWLTSPNSPDDFAVANIGQVKNLFSFEIPTANLLNDSRSDRLAAGQSSASLALQSNATWIWNDHFNNGSEFDRSYPRRMSRLPGIQSVSAGERYLVALANDGTVWTWGDNAVGQLGDGTNISRSVPAAVPDLGDIVSVKAGGSHVLALRADGTLVAWGDNYYGQLGTGDTTSSATFTAVPNLQNVQKIAAGYGKSAALTMDGTVWTWGYDHYNGQDIFYAIPVAVPELLDVVDLAAGYEHMVAVKSDGTVWAWGSNYANQVGNGNPAWKYQDAPSQVPNLPPIAKVASSYDHTLAIATDGTVWAWGYNFDGQLGDGTTDPRQTPVQVTGLTDAIAIATANTYSLAMKSDGTVWAWGDGAVGTLPGTDRHVPQLVGLGLFDTNHNGMDDRWEIQFLGSLDQPADADFDGDGMSNRLEFMRGTNPADYYNGVSPIIEITGGNNQIGAPAVFLPKPFKVRVVNAQRSPLINAPVTFRITDGAGALATTMGGVQQEQLSTRTDVNGEAIAYHALPDVPGISTRTIVTAGNSASPASATFRGITQFKLPPTPTPPPDPNATPSATPSPTATPVAPYRYAIIDLGKERYPKRINNNAQILVEGEDDNGNWGNFRWKGGMMERLTYAGAIDLPTAVDMNDSGVVVGYFWKFDPWVSNGENEREAGLTWAADKSEAVKTSAPMAALSWGFRLPGTVRQSFFSAINNKNEVFGGVRTSGGYEPTFHNEFSLYNAYDWTQGGASTQLSFGAATFLQASGTFAFSGAVDEISRANTDGHYIGSKLAQLRIVFANPAMIGGTRTGMVDGDTVSFAPVDINEAGIVVGSAGADMVVYSSPRAQIRINNASPLAINDHIRPAPPLDAQLSPTATPPPTPIPAPQVLSWTGNALVLWELQPNSGSWHPFGLEEMIPSLDGWDGLAPYDMNDNGLIVGTAWYTDPSNPTAPPELHGFLLVPCELMVDGNRDGEMSFDDQAVHNADQTSEDRPYRFWVNDDDDGAAGDLDDHVPPVAPDYADGIIRSIRDLEDFSRLHVNLAGFEEAIESGSIQAAFEWKETSGNPRIKLYRASKPGLDYLTNESVANALTITPFRDTLGEVAIGAPLFLAQGFWTRNSAFTNVPKTLPIAWLLFEGSGEGKGELVVSFWKDGRKIGETPGVWLDLKNVRTMYERGKISVEAPDIPDPWDNSQPAALQWTWDPWQWPPDIDAASDDAIVFVHGWRMTYQEYLTWADTTFKRLNRLGYKGRFYAFHWPTFNGENNGLNPADLFVPGGTTYNPSEYRAWLSGPALTSFVNSLPGSKKYLVAHSMGNVVAGSALRTGMQVSRYAMCNAAVAAMAYDQNIVDFNYETPDTDSDQPTRLTFGLANRLNPSGTKLINFGLPADYELGQWNAIYQFFKPQPRVKANYFYRPLNSPGRKLTYEGLVTVRIVTSVAEAIGYVTQSRSAAEGTKQSVSGSIDAVVNMGSGGFGFGTEHSAEWEFNMQRTYPFWREILHQFDISVPSQP